MAASEVIVEVADTVIEDLEMTEAVGPALDLVGQVTGRVPRVATIILPIVKSATDVGRPSRQVLQLNHTTMEADKTRNEVQEGAMARDQKEAVVATQAVVVEEEEAPTTATMREIEAEIDSESVTEKEIEIGSATATVIEIEIGIETAIVIGIEEAAEAEVMVVPREVT